MYCIDVTRVKRGQAIGHVRAAASPAVSCTVEESVYCVADPMIGTTEKKPYNKRHVSIYDVMTDMAVTRMFGVCSA